MAFGRFTMSGYYWCETRSCGWRKQYIGKHEVHYRGEPAGAADSGDVDADKGQWRLLDWPAEYGELTAEFFVESVPEQAPVEPTRVEAPD